MLVPVLGDRVLIGYAAPAETPVASSRRVRAFDDHASEDLLELWARRFRQAAALSGCSLRGRQRVPQWA